VNRSLWVAAGASALGLASIFFMKLSVFALLALVVATLLQKPEALHKNARAGVLVAGAVCTLIGLCRFIVEVAMPGIIAGGATVAVNGAVSKLREIRTAEDALRTHAFWDPDHDGIGSAGTLAELSGTRPLRGVRALEIAPLHPRFGVLAQGTHGDVATVDDYCYVVFVPDDDEQAERRFIAYAWPSEKRAAGPAVFLDEHEHIYVSEEARYRGLQEMPAFDAALSSSSWAANPPADGTPAVDGQRWKVWRKKKPMTSLAGETPLQSDER
jgi:hypothetical protein